MTFSAITSVFQFFKSLFSALPSYLYAFVCVAAILLIASSALRKFGG